MAFCNFPADLLVLKIRERNLICCSASYKKTSAAPLPDVTTSGVGQQMFSFFTMQSDSLRNGHGLVEPVLNGLAGSGEELLHRAGSVAGFLLQIRTFGEIADDGISHRLRR